MLADQYSQLLPNTPANLQVVFGGFSSAGIKAENQDAFAAFTPQNSELITKGAVAVLADGVSSASHAAQAAQLVVTQFIEEFYATSDTWSTMKSASKVLAGLNQWLYSQESQLENANYLSVNQQWLTTLTALVLCSNTAHIFHIGDSRLYQLRNDKLEQLTRDHNQKRAGKSAILTRALGADIRVKIDTQQIELQAGDTFLLTSDGVHDFIASHQLQQQLAALAATSNSQQLEHIAANLVQLALDNGSDDNISCLLVHINQVPSKDSTEIERQLYHRAIPPALTAGMKIDGYQVIKPIHASIRSHLYLVQHEHDNKAVVLKAPSVNFADDAIYLQGFIREAWVGERIKPCK